MHRQDGIDYLRQSQSEEIEHLSDLIGFEALDALFRCYAGRDAIYVPVEADADHPITKAIGSERAEALSSDFGGSRIEVRGSKRLFARLRELRRLEDAIREGEKTCSELAVEFECTARWVRVRAQKLGVKLPQAQSSASLRVSMIAREVDALTPKQRAAIAEAVASSRREYGSGLFDAISRRFGISPGAVKRVALMTKDDAAARKSLGIAPDAERRIKAGAHHAGKLGAGRPASTPEEKLALGRRPAIAEAVRAAKAAGEVGYVTRIAERLNVSVEAVNYVRRVLSDIESGQHTSHRRALPHHPSDHAAPRQGPGLAARKA